MYRYKITDNTSYECVISSDATPQEGWYVSAEPIVWADKLYVNGEIADKPTPVVPEPEPYVPSAEEIKQQLINAVQSHLDATAKAKGYDNILSAVTYAGDMLVPQFDVEGQAYKTWRTQVWAFCYAYLADVQAGTKAVPTASELIALLPAPPAPIEYVMYGNNA